MVIYISYEHIKSFGMYNNIMSLYHQFLSVIFTISFYLEPLLLLFRFILAFVKMCPMEIFNKLHFFFSYFILTYIFVHFGYGFKWEPECGLIFSKAAHFIFLGYATFGKRLVIYKPIYYLNIIMDYYSILYLLTFISY